MRLNETQTRAADLENELLDLLDDVGGGVLDDLLATLQKDRRECEDELRGALLELLAESTCPHANSSNFERAANNAARLLGETEPFPMYGCEVTR